MKKNFLIAAILIGFALPVKSNPPGQTNRCITTMAGPLAVYTGKYKMKRNDGMDFYITLSVENGQLVALELWDNAKKYLNYISGDDFIVDGFGWAVSFQRDDHKKVNGLVVRGTNTWIKVEE